jgi:hypothetical protein
MASLKGHKVYENLGRVLDKDDPPVVDVITSGLKQLTEAVANPLNQYNQAFKQLQQRCLQKPITGGSPSPPNPNPLSEMEGDLSEKTSAALTAIAPPALPKAALTQARDHEPEASDDEESDRSSVATTNLKMTRRKTQTWTAGTKSKKRNSWATSTGLWMILTRRRSR